MNWKLFEDPPKPGTRFVALRKKGCGATMFFRTPEGVVVDIDAFRMPTGDSDDGLRLWFESSGYAFWMPLPEGQKLYFEEWLT